MKPTNDVDKIAALLLEDMPPELISKFKKDINDLGYQGFLLSINGLGYPEEVVTKVKDLQEYLERTAGTQKG